MITQNRLDMQDQYEVKSESNDFQQNQRLSRNNSDSFLVDLQIQKNEIRNLQKNEVEMMIPFDQLMKQNNQEFKIREPSKRETQKLREIFYQYLEIQKKSLDEKDLFNSFKEKIDQICVFFEKDQSKLDNNFFLKKSFVHSERKQQLEMDLKEQIGKYMQKYEELEEKLLQLELQKQNSQSNIDLNYQPMQSENIQESDLKYQIQDLTSKLQDELKKSVKQNQEIDQLNQVQFDNKIKLDNYAQQDIQIQQLIQENTQLKKDVSNLTIENVNLKQNIQDFVKNNDDLNNKLDNQKKSLKELEAQIEEEKFRQQSSEIRFNRINIKIHELMSSYQDLSIQKANIQSEVADKDSQILLIQQQIQNLQQEIAQKDSQLEQFKCELLKKESKIQSSDQIYQANNEFFQKMEQSLKSYQLQQQENYKVQNKVDDCFNSQYQWMFQAVFLLNIAILYLTNNYIM